MQSVTARADMIATLEDTVVKNQSVIIDLFVVFTGIVFFGSILNSSLLSLAERQHNWPLFACSATALGGRQPAAA